MGSSCSSRRISSRNRNGELSMVKCFHELPVIHEICKRPPNKGNNFFGCPLWKVDGDCGYFRWDEEVEILIAERNKILEQRIEELVAENEKLGNELSNLKGNKQRKNIRDEDNSASTWNVQEEISILRKKIAKEKQKMAVAEDQLKIVREELMALELKCCRKDKVILCVAVMVIVLVIARFM